MSSGPFTCPRSSPASPELMPQGAQGACSQASPPPLCFNSDGTQLHPKAKANGYTPFHPPKSYSQRGLRTENLE